MLLTIMVQAHAEELASSHAIDTHDQLVDRMLKTWRSAPLDGTMLDKGPSGATMAASRRLTLRTCNTFKRLPHAAPAGCTVPAVSELPAVQSTPLARMPQAFSIVSAARPAVLVHAAHQSSNSDVGKSRSDWKMVLFRTPSARELFRETLSKFQCPATDWNEVPKLLLDTFRDTFEEKGGSRAVSAFKSTTSGMPDILQKASKFFLYKGAWALTKWDIERRSEKDEDIMPVVAMKGEAACAAAIYSETQRNRQNAFVLSRLIRNAGDDCAGAGAAIVCHLIRNSKDSMGEFSPLKIVHSNEFVGNYFESFGCTMRRFPFFECLNQNPQKCTQYDDELFTSSGDSLQNLRPFFRLEAFGQPR